MSEAAGCPAGCCRSTRPASGAAGVYCANCDALVGLPGMHVVAVERVERVQTRRGEGLLVTVEGSADESGARPQDRSSTRPATIRGGPPGHALTTCRGRPERRRRALGAPPT